MVPKATSNINQQNKVIDERLKTRFNTVADVDTEEEEDEEAQPNMTDIRPRKRSKSSFPLSGFSIAPPTIDSTDIQPNASDTEEEEAQEEEEEEEEDVVVIEEQVNPSPKGLNMNPVLKCTVPVVSEESSQDRQDVVEEEEEDEEQEQEESMESKFENGPEEACTKETPMTEIEINETQPRSNSRPEPERIKDVISLCSIQRIQTLRQYLFEKRRQVQTLRSTKPRMPVSRQCSVSRPPCMASSTTNVPQDPNPKTLEQPQGPTEINHEALARVNAELEKVLTKSEFSDMTILGQFNLGFMIAKHEQDLFILDQHASDEKATYEHLRKTTVLQSQPLVVPMPLHSIITAVDEMTILDNVSTFETFGFRFDIDSSAPTRHKIKLCAIPWNKHTQFDVSDITELASIMQENPDAREFRLPKLDAMLASRACRSSVMIGTPLSVDEMTDITARMATLNQPWNCPHGYVCVDSNVLARITH